jgi:hypothetical protein
MQITWDFSRKRPFYCGGHAFQSKSRSVICVVFQPSLLLGKAHAIYASASGKRSYSGSDILTASSCGIGKRRRKSLAGFMRFPAYLGRADLLRRFSVQLRSFNQSFSFCFFPAVLRAVP